MSWGVLLLRQGGQQHEDKEELVVFLNTILLIIVALLTNIIETNTTLGVVNHLHAINCVHICALVSNIEYMRVCV